MPDTFVFSVCGMFFWVWRGKRAWLCGASGHDDDPGGDGIGGLKTPGDAPRDRTDRTQLERIMLDAISPREAEWR